MLMSSLNHKGTSSRIELQTVGRLDC